MTAIKQILNTKGRGFFSIAPEETVYAAMAFMAEANIGSLLVIDDGVLVGIITERDYAREIVLKGRTSSQTLVREIMKIEVPCITPNESVETCMELMTEDRIRHLPVVDSGRVVGVVSIGDLVKSVINDQRFVIEQLEDYIHGELRHH
jgi:CBS domain-containing protein